MAKIGEILESKGVTVVESKSGKETPKKTVENTQHPESLRRSLLEGMLCSASGEPDRGIRNQEARGQRELVASDVLPSSGLVTHGYMQDEETDRLIPRPCENPLPMIEILGPVDGDDLFVYVRLPEGWKKVPGENSMWSNLVDEKGRIRAAIFYKAAFYDRKADLHPRTRFKVTTEYKYKGFDPNRPNPVKAKVLDGEEVIFETEFSVDAPGNVGSVCDKAEAWLTEQYPDWRNHNAYWD